MNDKKIAIILRDDLKTWQKLNVTAFLASAVTITYPELHGGHLLTASGGRYMPFIKQPVLVYKGEGLELMKRAFNRAKERELGIGIYPSPLFETMTEEDNLADLALNCVIHPCRDE
jgi:hypothetical protein